MVSADSVSRPELADDHVDLLTHPAPAGGHPIGLISYGSAASRTLARQVDWIRQCAGWLTHLDASECPPAVNLRCLRRSP